MAKKYAKPVQPVQPLPGLKVYSSYEELKAARAQRGAKEPPAAHLLSDDHFRKRKRVNCTLGPQAIALAKKLGNGVASRGVEFALLHYIDCPRTDRRKRHRKLEKK